MPKQMLITVGNFLCHLDKTASLLDKFQLEISGREEKVFAAINKLTQAASGSAGLQGDRNDPLYQAVLKSIDNLSKRLGDWQTCVEKTKKGQQFIHQHEKQLMAVVFGKVNTGKSTLGNFLAGKDFLKADFDNPYKRISKPAFEMYESGREGNMANGWFAEGDVDTTGAIQFFTMPGFCWVDSPGIGSVIKEGDTVNMEALAKEYVQYADLVVFLMSSDSPGLQQDFDQIASLNTNSKPALLLITKSDEVDEDFDDDGNLIKQEIVPKSTERRRSQEDYLRRSLLDKGLISQEIGVDSLSVSVFLAQKALKNKNDQDFADSNFGGFLSLLSDRLGAKALALKQRNPRANINRLINDVISGVVASKSSDGFPGVTAIKTEFGALKARIADYRSRVLCLEAKIAQQILAQSMVKVQDYLDDARHKLEVGSNDAMSSQQLSTAITEILKKTAQPIFAENVVTVIQHFTDDVTMSLNIKVDYNLEKQYDSLERKVHHYERVERAPDGVLEKVKSKVFNSRYYSAREWTSTEYVQLAVGTNVYEIFEKIKADMDNQIKGIVKAEIEAVANNYFNQLEIYVDHVIADIVLLEQELAVIKYQDIE